MSRRCRFRECAECLTLKLKLRNKRCKGRHGDRRIDCEPGRHPSFIRVALGACAARLRKTGRTPCVTAWNAARGLAE
eukprot:scaffold8867_cov118-Isochrysis_galbana.AAC.2